MRGPANRHAATILFWALMTGAAVADADPDPVIALIIDDLGDRELDGRRAVELPGPVTYSFLPKTPFARRLARLAHQRNKEVMLHLPMEAIGGNRLGPGGLTLNMDRNRFIGVLRENLQSVPYVRGINNHMGSLLTSQPSQMTWLMQEMTALGGLYFVDSRTTHHTVACKVALEYRVPNTRRDVFLDNSHDPEAIFLQFAKLIKVAQRRGQAVAIGHARPETLTVLENTLPNLDTWGVRMVPISEYIALQEQRSWKLWQASLSPSQQASKNSKPSP